MGTTYDLARHTASTLDEYRTSNPALGLIPGEHLSRVTHVAADVTLPADAVCFVYATYLVESGAAPGSERMTVAEAG